MTTFLRAIALALAIVCMPAWATTTILASGQTSATSSTVTVTGTATVALFPGAIGGNAIDLPVYILSGSCTIPACPKVADLTPVSPTYSILTPGSYVVVRPDITATGQSVGVTSDVSSGSGGGGGTVTPTGQTAMAGALSVAIASDQTAVPVSGSVTANLGTLNGAATAAAQASLLTAVGSPFQAGGSIGNTTFAATQSGTWNIGSITTLPALVAGNASIGSVGLTATNGSIAGASSQFKLISAASTNGTSVKTTVGTVVTVVLSNTTASTARYVKFYAKASAPSVGTDVPIITVLVPANSTVSIDVGPYGIKFANGIAFAITGASADTDTTAVSAGDIIVNLVYI